MLVDDSGILFIAEIKRSDPDCRASIVRVLFLEDFHSALVMSPANGIRLHSSSGTAKGKIN